MEISRVYEIQIQNSQPLFLITNSMFYCSLWVDDDFDFKIFFNPKRQSFELRKNNHNSVPAQLLYVCNFYFIFVVKHRLS